jgi:uncharacterized protein (TIGR02996 family)
LTEAGLLYGVLDTPDDPAARLVLADWYAEHGEDVLAAAAREDYPVRQPLRDYYRQGCPRHPDGTPLHTPRDKWRVLRYCLERRWPDYARRHVEDILARRLAPAVEEG